MATFEVVVTADSNNARIYWKDYLADRLVELVGGVSIYEGWGMWRSDESQVVVTEPHFLLRALVRDVRETFAALRRALHLYKVEARQEVVFIIVDGEAYYLNDQVFEALQEGEEFMLIK